MRLGVKSGFMAAMFLIASNMAAQGDSSAAPMAKIEVDSAGSEFTFTATCLNKTFQTHQLSYKFDAKKIGRSGNANSSQSGDFSAKKGEQVTLSHSKLNVMSGDSLAITLDIFDDTVKIANDHIFKRLD